MEKLIILLLSFFIALPLFAQNKLTNTPSIRITGFSENLGLAAFQSNSPIHVGGAIAIAFSRKQQNNYRSYNTFELGYFKHKPLLQAAYVAWKPTYEWQFNNGLHLHALTGLGYIHALPTQQTYTQEDGTYQATTNIGKPGAMASLGIGIGYQLNAESHIPTTLFLRQEWMLVAPFNLFKDIPVGINAMLSIGVMVSPFQ